MQCIDYERTGCSMVRLIPALQDMDDRAEMCMILDRTRRRGIPIPYGGWVFPGAFRQFWKGEEIPGSIDAPPENLGIIKCAFYVQVSFTS